MRKLAVLLAICLMACSTVAFAEINIDSLTIEQLLQLKQDINTRIAELSEDGAEEQIGVGNYVVGKDIRASSFEIVFYVNDYTKNPYSTSEPSGSIELIDCTTGKRISGFSLSDKDVAYVDLKDGMTLNIDVSYTGNGGKFYIREVKSSWAPN